MTNLITQRFEIPASNWDMQVSEPQQSRFTGGSNYLDIDLPLPVGYRLLTVAQSTVRIYADYTYNRDALIGDMHGVYAPCDYSPTPGRFIARFVFPAMVGIAAGSPTGWFDAVFMKD